MGGSHPELLLGSDPAHASAEFSGIAAPAVRDSEQLNSHPQGPCISYLCYLANNPTTGWWLPPTALRVLRSPSVAVQVSLGPFFRASHRAHSRSWPGAAISFRGMTESGRACKLIHMAIGRTQFLTGGQDGGLLPPPAFGQRSPPSVPCPGGISNMAACFVIVCKLRMREREEDQQKGSHHLSELHLRSDFSSPCNVLFCALEVSH